MQKQNLSISSSKETLRRTLRSTWTPIRRVLKEATADAANGLINKEFVDEFIDKIYATMEEDGTMHLQVKIFTGEVTDKYLTSLRSRTGHTFNKKQPLLWAGIHKTGNSHSGSLICCACSCII